MRERGVAELRSGVLLGGSSYGDSMARVCVAIRGCEDVICESPDVLQLRCPLSGERVVCPVRFRGCKGTHCFDLDSFLQATAQSRRWACPHCKLSGTVDDLREDPWVGSIVDTLSRSSLLSDVVSVEIDEGGQWRLVGTGAAWITVPGVVADLLLSLKSLRTEGGGLKRKLRAEEEEGVIWLD